MDKRTGLVALALAAALSGCGTPADPLNITLAPMEALQLRGFMPEALRGQVALAAISGGAETSRYWGSQLSDKALTETLEGALRSVGLLAPLPGAARYQLSATLEALQQPDLKWRPQALVTENRVLATVSYVLKDSASGAVVYQRSVRTQHTAEFLAALLSQPERLKLANEGAMRQSLQLLLRDFTELPLPPPPR